MHADMTDMTDIAVFQNRNSVVTIGRTWAIVRYIPVDPLGPIYWERVTTGGQEDNLTFEPDVDLIVDIAITHSCWPVGHLAQYPSFAEVSSTVADVLRHASPETPVDLVNETWREMLRCKVRDDATGLPIIVLVDKAAVRRENGAARR